MKVVLVTGTSSGIGRESVKHLVAKGCHVVATARRLEDISDLASEQVTLLRLDVTDAKSMRAAVDTVLSEHGRIDALVNNAGFGAYLPVEETSVEQLKHIFEVNLFGLHDLTRLVLPHMRKAGGGRIVNVSSVAGHISIPVMGPYCASKFALRAMTTAMRAELRPFAIHASIVEPGRILTEFGKRARAETTGPDESPYADLHRRWARLAFNDKGAHSRVIARRIAHACTARRPKPRYTAPMDARAGRLAARLLPERFLDLAFRIAFRFHPKQTP